MSIFDALIFWFVKPIAEFIFAISVFLAIFVVAFIAFFISEHFNRKRRKTK